MFFGILVLLTALSISAVAIYYSVAGLVAIFAAATVPIIIMGSVLEVSKLVTAVWLHRYWRDAAWWLKTYLCAAVAVLMIITSTGIFGFLSRAHIEQTASATDGLAQIEQIDETIARQQSQIERSLTTIKSLQTSGNEQDLKIQGQIDKEQERIDNAYQRVEPAINEQQYIINQQQAQTQKRIGDIEFQISSIDQDLENLRSALAANNIEIAQGIVGVKADGDLGPNTKTAIEEFRNNKQNIRKDLVSNATEIRTQPDLVITNARDEIKRLRNLAEQQIADSNKLISRLRTQIGTTNQDIVEQEISIENDKIVSSREKISELLDEKYKLEVEYRKLEAEVGPIKYLAEFIYGEDADKDLLEEAVRWVIIIIIFVFDPLAVLLLIASQYTFELHKKRKKDPLQLSNNTYFAKKIKEEALNAEREYLKKKQCAADLVQPTETKDEDLEETKDIIDFPDYVKIATEYQDESREQAYERKEQEFKNDKESWKKDHPTETLKFYKTLFLQGKIDSLPWENYSPNNKQN